MYFRLQKLNSTFTPWFCHIFPCFYLRPSLIYNDFPSRLRSSCQQPAIIFECVGFLSGVSWGGWDRLIFFIIAHSVWKSITFCSTGRLTTRKQTNTFSRCKGEVLFFSLRAIIGQILTTTRPWILNTLYNWVIRLRAILWFARCAVIWRHLLHKPA